MLVEDFQGGKMIYPGYVDEETTPREMLPYLCITQHNGKVTVIAERLGGQGRRHMVPFFGLDKHQLTTCIAALNEIVDKMPPPPPPNPNEGQPEK